MIKSLNKDQKNRKNVVFSNCDGKSDEEIAKMAIKNQDCFGCLITRFEEKLTRYIRRITNVSNEEVEDLLQDIFIKAYRNLEDFDQSLKFSSWIYRIAHNHVISQWRKRKTRPQVIDFEGNEDIFRMIASNEDLARDIERKIEGSRVREAIAELDEKYREVLVLKYLEGRDYAEISDILRKPIGTVATLINRAKKKLGEIIKEKNILH